MRIEKRDASAMQAQPFPHAIAQCRGWLALNLPDAEVQASNSTADAARLLATEPDGRTAVIAPSRAADAYGLEVLAADVEEVRRALAALTGTPVPRGKRTRSGSTKRPAIFNR